MPEFPGQFGKNVDPSFAKYQTQAESTLQEVRGLKRDLAAVKSQYEALLRRVQRLENL